MSGALATLFKAVLVIGVCSIFIFIYTFKDKKGKMLELVGIKPELEMQENRVELEEKNFVFEKNNGELEKKKLELERIEQEEEEMKADLERKKPELDDVELELELEGKLIKFEGGKAELEDKKAELDEEKPQLEIDETNSELEEGKAELEEKKQKEEICGEPKTNILFLKTHKTGGTTVFKILERFAHKNLLLVAEKINPRYWPHKFLRCSLYPLKPRYEYNIFAHHAMFNYEEMKAVMPDDTKFLTILRDPVTQFESTYGFFHMEDVYGMNLIEFANLDMLDRKWAEIKGKRRKGRNGINPNAFDLGIDPALFDDEEAILEKVQELDGQLDLVMLTERFDESIILMMDELCWTDMNDVMYFKWNVRNPEVRAKLSPENENALRLKNRADQIIYDYFYHKFQRRIEAFGKEKMKREVEKMSNLTRTMNEVCLTDESTFDPRGIVNVEYRKEAEDLEMCRNIIKYEVFSNWKKLQKRSKLMKPEVECPY